MDETTLQQQAEDALARGDLHAAAALCKTILEQYPQSARGYHLMSSLFQATGNYQKARDYSAHATELDMFVAQYHVQQGHILFTMKDFAGAKSAFERASKLAASDIEPSRMVARCLMQLEQFREARTWLAQMRERFSDKYTALDEAECCMLSGENEEAERLLSSCIANNTNHASAHFMLALIALQNMEIARAEQLLRKTLVLDANLHDAHFYLALLLAEKGDDRAAVERLMQALQLAPTHIPSLLLLGGVFMKLGDSEASQKAFLHVVALSPAHLIAWHSLLELFRAQNKKEEGVARLEAAIAHTHSQPLMHLRALYRGDSPAYAPKYFVANFYDTLLDAFEPWMIAGGDTRHMDALVAELRALPALESKRYISVLDLGCGVGAFTKLLGDWAAIRVGVDVSSHMLKIARRHKIFDVVYEMDLLEYVNGSETTFDIVTATGALRWIGNLQPFIQAARGVMREDGVLAFMLEKENSTLAYCVNNSGRYSHSYSYVLDITQAEGFQLLTHKELVWIAPDEGLAFRHLFIFKKATLH